MENRNTIMMARIENRPVKYPFRFIVLGDSAGSPKPVTGDAVFTDLLAQIEQLNPKPVFFVHLGDLAGPGSLDRHEHYLRLVERLTIPNVCLIGNHDHDDPLGIENFQGIHGPCNFQFTYGHTLFVAIKSTDIRKGLDEETLAYLEKCLRENEHPHRVILMHMPPNLNLHYTPHDTAQWAFRKSEPEFLAIVKKYDVKLVCCGHLHAYDYYVHDGVSYVVSGGGGQILCSHYGGCFTLKMGTPPHRGSFYHFVEVTVRESGVISGRVIRAFEQGDYDPDYRFGEEREN